MNAETKKQPAVLVLEPGDKLAVDPQLRTWRLRSGALRITRNGSDGGPVLAGVALPGDLIGVAALLPLPPCGEDALVLHAMTPSRLDPVILARPGDLTLLVAEALNQSRRQCGDLARLRGGSVMARLRFLLLALTAGEAGVGVEAGPETSTDADAPPRSALPSLRDMADLIDAAPESVSRAFGSLRDLSLLHDRHPHQARISRQALGRLHAPSSRHNARAATRDAATRDAASRDTARSEDEEPAAA
jgi:hypothetical protein